MSKWVNMNQDWQFIKKPVRREALKNEKMITLDLPHTWNAEDGVSGGNNYHRGQAWYVKAFKTEEHVGRIYLDFEGANSVCEVYLNDQHLGRHEGGYSGFRYDITQILKDENVLEVMVDNTHIEEVYPLWADFTFYGGIYRNVNLIYTSDCHFEKEDLASSGVYVSQRKISKEMAEVEVKALLRNHGNQVEAKCEVKFVDAEGNMVAADQAVSSVSDQATVVFNLNIEDPTLWHGVENPYLYDCVATLTVDDKVIDELHIPTGLRFFEFNEETGFALNGESMKLNGVSRHQDRAGVGNALLPEHQEEDMALIKEIGANAIRLAHYQHNQYFYDLCDREGMVIWAEIPYISKTSDTDDTGANAVSQMRELVRQCYNHPSILLWGVQNEIGIMGEDKPLSEIAGQIHDVVKEEDTTRVTTQAQVMMTDEEDPSHYTTDTVAWNKYYGWYVGEVEGFREFIESFRAKNPGKAFGISEYGAEGILSWHSDDPKVKDYSEEYHALYHEKALKIFNEYPFVWGTYVWNMFDFGSDMRDEGGVQGMNNKGLVTFDRTVKKDAFYWYQSMWSKKPMLHINSKRFVKRHLDTIEVKVYSNQPEVTVTCNGNEVALKEKDGTIFLFDISLSEGENVMIAKAGNLIDTARFEKVDQKEMSYVLPEEERKKGMSLDDGENVINWFDKELPSDNIVFEYPEGMLSIKEPIKVLLKYNEGEAVLREYLAPMFEHTMFKMLKGFSLEKLAGMQAGALPDSLLSVINKELTQIKK